MRRRTYRPTERLSSPGPSLFACNPRLYGRGFCIYCRGHDKTNDREHVHACDGFVRSRLPNNNDGGEPIATFTYPFIVETSEILDLNNEGVKVGVQADVHLNNFIVHQHFVPNNILDPDRHEDAASEAVDIVASVLRGLVQEREAS